MSDLDRDQRMTVVAVLVENKPFRLVSESFLGRGHVPTEADFDSKDGNDCDRCEVFLRFVMEQLADMRDEIRRRPRRPRQAEIDFDAREKAEAERKKNAAEEKRKKAAALKTADKERKERAIVSKGDKAGRKAAVDALTGGKRVGHPGFVRSVKKAAPKKKATTKGKGK